MKYIITAIILASFLLITGCGGETGPGETFAKCVTDSGAVMYGAYWCPHCMDQKDSFGDSWDYVNYVECSLPNRGGQTQECADAGIESYPTWEFGDGSRESGFIALEVIAETTGCVLPTE